MTIEEVTQKILGTLEELQRLSGRTCDKLTGTTKPIGGLEGFDSLSAIEATVAIEVAIGIEFPTDNIFVADIDGRKQAITAAEAAKCVLQFASKLP